MTNSINLTISGGVANVGNVVQGDHNSVNAVVSPSTIETHFARTNAAISKLGKELQLPETAITSALERLNELKSEAAKPHPDSSLGSRLLTGIKENFGWAYPLTKEFLSIAWPALSSIIGT
jgi:hypothetical protein